MRGLKAISLVRMPGSVDFIAIALVALVAYVLWTPVYSREQTNSSACSGGTESSAS